MLSGFVFIAPVIAEKSKARPPVLKFVTKDSPCYVGLNKDEPGTGEPSLANHEHAARAAVGVVDQNIDANPRLGRNSVRRHERT